MSVKLFKNLYGGFCFAMSGYGFSRGFRAAQSDNQNQLTTNTIFGSCLNGFYYGAPVINIFPTIRLINRIEIEERGLNRDLYKSEYQELCGVCNDTY